MTPQDIEAYTDRHRVRLVAALVVGFALLVAAGWLFHACKEGRFVGEVTGPVVMKGYWNGRHYFYLKLDSERAAVVPVTPLTSGSVRYGQHYAGRAERVEKISPFILAEWNE